MQYDSVCKWVFKCFLNVSKLSNDLMWSGRPFHILAAAKWNDLCPVVVFIHGSFNNNLDVEHSLCTGLYSSMNSARYIGCFTSWILKTSIAVLYVILARIGSQCRSKKTGEMWSQWRVPMTTRGRVFWTRCSLSRLASDIPIKGHCSNPILNRRLPKPLCTRYPLTGLL